MTVEEILTTFPGLKKNFLDRAAKKLHLATAYQITGFRAEEILNEMYGPRYETGMCVRIIEKA